MTEIVKAYLFQAVVLQYDFKVLCQEVRFDKLPNGIYIDVIQIVFAVCGSAYLLVDLLLSLQAMEQSFKRCYQR